MKKYILSFIVLLSIPALSNAQKMYVDLNAGYGLKLSALQYGSSSYNSGATTYKSKTISLGSGIDIGGNFGYSFNENLAGEIGFNYFMNRLKTNDRSGYAISNFSSTTYQYENNWTTSMLRIIPSLRSTITCGKCKIYSKLGLIMGYMGRSTQDEKTTHVYTDMITPANSTKQVDEDVWEYSGGMSFGLLGSMGMLYPLNDKMALSLDANIFAQNWAPAKATLTKSTTDGNDNLPNMTTAQKEIDFVNEYTTGTNPPPSTSPQKQIKIYYPMNAVYFNLGIHISISKKKEESK